MRGKIQKKAPVALSRLFRPEDPRAEATAQGVQGATHPLQATCDYSVAPPGEDTRSAALQRVRAL